MPQNPNVCMSLAILDLDTSAIPVMSLDASPRSVTEAAALSSMPFFGSLFGNMCVKHLSNL